MACSAGVVGRLLPREAEEGPGVDMRVQSLGVQFIGRSWARRRWSRPCPAPQLSRPGGGQSLRDWRRVPCLDPLRSRARWWMWVRLASVLILTPLICPPSALPDTPAPARAAASADPGKLMLAWISIPGGFAPGLRRPRHPVCSDPGGLEGSGPTLALTTRRASPSLSRVPAAASLGLLPGRGP